MATKTWTPEEIALLKNNWATLSREDFKKLLGRSWSAINTKAYNMNLFLCDRPAEDAQRLNSWTEEEKQLLRDKWYTSSRGELEELLNRSFARIHGQAMSLGLLGRKEKEIKEQNQHLKHYVEPTIEKKPESNTERPPAVYSNRNLREELLAKYAG